MMELARTLLGQLGELAVTDVLSSASPEKT